MKKSYQITPDELLKFKAYCLAETREHIRNALQARKYNPESYGRWIQWAKESAAIARRLAKKFGVHFGKLSQADRQAVYTRIRLSRFGRPCKEGEQAEQPTAIAA